MLCLALALPLSLPAGDLTHVEVPFASTPQWFVLDEARQRAVVSLPDEDKLAVVSLVTYEVLGEHFVGQRPRGLSLSLDGEELYVALGLSGSVAVVDAEDYQVDRTINVTDLLGDSRTWDVSEGKPGHLYVSGNPGSSGLAWIVQVELDNDDAQSRVADNRILRAAPEFLESHDLESLYIGESIFSPNSLYKLDLTQSDAPIVLEDDHGSISGARDMALSPDGERIVLYSGQVLSTETFVQLGSVGVGEPGFDPSEGGAFVWRVSAPRNFERFDFETFLSDSALPTSCSLGSGVFTSTSSFLVRPGGLGYLALAGDALCGEAVVGPPFVQLAGLEPDSAPWDAPTTAVEVQGAFFSLAPVVQVSLGGEPVEASVLDDTRLLIQVPAGSPGPVDLLVENTTGATLLASAFRRTPALANTTPAAGPGDTLGIEVALEAFDAVLLFVGAPGPSQSCPPLGGELAIDLGSDPVVLTQLVWPFDELGLSFPLPDDPVLIGAELRLQALVGDLAQPQAAFSNPVDVAF